jgi:hypothetical protein
MITPTDPGAMDLAEIGQQYVVGDKTTKTILFSRLVAAVEALRARVAGLARQERAQYSLRMQRRVQLEAAEARVATLAEVLAAITDMEGQEGMTDGLFFVETMDLAHTVLAATPADALEQARAVESKGYADRSVCEADDA